MADVATALWAVSFPLESPVSVNRPQTGGYSVPLIALISGRGELVNESGDSFEGSLIDVFLRFTRCLELAFRHAQRMIAAVDYVQEVWRFHVGSDALQ